MGLSSIKYGKKICEICIRENNLEENDYKTALKVIYDRVYFISPSGPFGSVPKFEKIKKKDIKPDVFEDRKMEDIRLVVESEDSNIENTVLWGGRAASLPRGLTQTSENNSSRDIHYTSDEKIFNRVGFLLGYCGSFGGSIVHFYPTDKEGKMAEIAYRSMLEYYDLVMGGYSLPEYGLPKWTSFRATRGFDVEWSSNAINEKGWIKSTDMIDLMACMSGLGITECLVEFENTCNMSQLNQPNKTLYSPSYFYGPDLSKLGTLCSFYDVMRYHWEHTADEEWESMDEDARNFLITFRKSDISYDVIRENVLRYGRLSLEDITLKALKNSKDRKDVVFRRIYEGITEQSCVVGDLLTSVYLSLCELTKDKEASVFAMIHMLRGNTSYIESIIKKAINLKRGLNKRGKETAIENISFTSAEPFDNFGTLFDIPFVYDRDDRNDMKENFIQASSELNGLIEKVKEVPDRDSVRDMSYKIISDILMLKFNNN